MKGSAPDTGSMSILEAAQDVRLGSTPPRLGLVTRDAFGWTPLRRGVSRPEVEELTGDSASSVVPAGPACICVWVRVKSSAGTVSRRGTLLDRREDLDESDPASISLLKDDEGAIPGAVCLKL